MQDTPHQKKQLKAIHELMKSKFFTLARTAIDAALLEAPQSVPLRLSLLELYQQTNDHWEAKRLLDELVIEQPENDKLFMGYPKACLGCGETEQAIERALELSERLGSDNFTAQGVLADMYETTSRIDELSDLCDRMTPGKPIEHVGVKVCRAKIAGRKKDYEKAAALCEEAYLDLCALEGSLDQSILNDRKVDLGFQLAKHYDRLGEYDKAWASAKQAHLDNEEKSKRFSASDYEKAADEIIKFFSGKVLRSLAHAIEPQPHEPLYIIGNPRSGTSLLEQILSMHPMVANGGEMSITMRMQEAVPSLTDSYNPWPLSLMDMRTAEADVLGRQYTKALEYFVNDEKIVSNKALNLQMQVGFLSLVTPSARGIMLYRHPLDNCVSCFTTNLLSSGHVYCSDLDNLGRVWLARRRLQEHWLEHVEMPLMELHYESLVQNQEHETRRLIEFLGLEWNEQCLEFYKSKFVARTISYDQVNRKMYTTSDGRWKNYEKHLGPLIERLADYL